MRNEDEQRMQMGMTGQDSQHDQLKGESITNRINTKTALCFTELLTFSLSKVVNPQNSTFSVNYSGKYRMKAGELHCLVGDKFSWLVWAVQTCTVWVASNNNYIIHYRRFGINHSPPFACVCQCLHFKTDRQNREIYLVISSSSSSSSSSHH